MVKYISERNKKIMFISNSEMKCIVANSATSPSIQTYFSRLLHSISWSSRIDPEIFFFNYYFWHFKHSIKRDSYMSYMYSSLWSRLLEGVRAGLICVSSWLSDGRWWQTSQKEQKSNAIFQATKNRPGKCGAASVSFSEDTACPVNWSKGALAHVCMHFFAYAGGWLCVFPKCHSDYLTISLQHVLK